MAGVQPVITAAVVAIRSGVFEGTVPPLDRAIGPGTFGLGEPVFDAIGWAEVVEAHRK